MKDSLLKKSLLKVSIITAVYNREEFIANAIASIKEQDYSSIEHIVVDGNSTDNTVRVVRNYMLPNTVLISESDEGIYDAINKGIHLSSGEIIGLLHSDDFFMHKSIISEIAEIFEDPTIDAVYGDLEYVSKKNPANVIRHWHAGCFSKIKLRWGWMPPHPTLFLRRRVFESLGVYDVTFRISSDYDAVLRYFGKGNVKSRYISKVIVRMRVGGESNKSLASIFRKSQEDFRCLRHNKVGGIGALFWKNFSKLRQFVIH